MINLLPETEKSLIQKEYHLRLIGLWLVFAFVATLVCLVLLTPSYILSYYQNTAELRAAATAAGNTQGPNALAVLTSTNALVSVLAPATAAGTTTSPSDIIDLIVGDRGANTISSFSYSENAGGASGGSSAATAPTVTAPTITIQGIAKDRDSLLSMNQALQGESVFASVNLPISDLALDTNIPFSMTITVKSQ